MDQFKQWKELEVKNDLANQEKELKELIQAVKDDSEPNKVGVKSEITKPNGQIPEKSL